MGFTGEAGEESSQSHDVVRVRRKAESVFCALQYTDDEMRKFEAHAEQLLEPKVKQLEQAFSLFDRDGGGLLRVPHLTAYTRILNKRDDAPVQSEPHSCSPMSPSDDNLPHLDAV